MGRKRITQTKLGEILGIPQASIYRRLNGKISFSFNELLIIASYMGITVGELVGSGLLNAKSSTPLQVSQEGRAGKKIAPVEMISTGARRATELLHPAATHTTIHTALQHLNLKLSAEINTTEKPKTGCLNAPYCSHRQPESII